MLDRPMILIVYKGMPPEMGVSLFLDLIARYAMHFLAGGPPCRRKSI